MFIDISPTITKGTSQCFILELNSRPSSVTTFSIDFSFQNLVFYDLIDFFSENSHLKFNIPQPKSKS
jgi:hypothetical protein